MAHPRPVESTLRLARRNPPCTKGSTRRDPGTFLRGLGRAGFREEGVWEHRRRRLLMFVLVLPSRRAPHLGPLLLSRLLLLLCLTGLPALHVELALLPALDRAHR